MELREREESIPHETQREREHIAEHKTREHIEGRTHGQGHDNYLSTGKQTSLGKKPVNLYQTYIRKTIDHQSSKKTTKYIQLLLES